MRFVVDMNLSPLWAARLRREGYEAVHWTQLGKSDAPDDEIMRYAARHESVILTHDLDFGAILASDGAAGPSVVQLREQDVDPDSIGDMVILAIEQCRAVLEQGALVTVDLRRAKARILPIRRLKEL